MGNFSTVGQTSSQTMSAPLPVDWQKWLSDYFRT